MEKEVVDIGFISKDVTEKAKQYQKKGYSIAHFSPVGSVPKAPHDDVRAAETLEEFVALIKEPRQIRVEVYSWQLLNSVMEMLTPLLGDGDLLIDDAIQAH